MARILHLVASPRGDLSYSRRAAEAFLEGYLIENPNDMVECIPLHDGSLPAFGALCVHGKYKIMSGQEQSPEESQAWQEVKKTIEHLKSADKLVISSPMWNFGLPYVLKQYLDIIIQPGLTFSFSSDTGYKGSITGKPAMLFLARGSDYSEESGLSGLDHQKPYLELALGFIGFTEITTILIEPTMQKGQSVAEAKLNEAIEKAKSKIGRF